MDAYSARQPLRGLNKSQAEFRVQLSPASNRSQELLQGTRARTAYPHGTNQLALHSFLKATVDDKLLPLTPPNLRSKTLESRPA